MYNLPRGNCWRCKHPYSEENVFTHAGYKELFISGTCEACFDELFPEEEEQDLPNTPEPDAQDLER